MLKGILILLHMRAALCDIDVLLRIQNMNCTYCLLTGEATRLMAWLVKNSRSGEVMRNLIQADGIPHLVTMATSEHVVMQNESLMAITLMASAVLGRKHLTKVLIGTSVTIEWKIWGLFVLLFFQHF